MKMTSSQSRQIEMEEKLRQIISQILRVDLEAVNENLSPDSTSNWDSLAHMNLVVALEEEFNVKFDDMQIVQMVNYEAIKLILKEVLDMAC